MVHPASPELHKKIEAMKLAYADLRRYNADPRFAKVPVQGLLSKDYAKERAKLIDPRSGQLQRIGGRSATQRHHLSDRN